MRDWKRKKRRLDLPPPVVLLEPRYVSRWGYDHDYSTELEVAAKEAGLDLTKEIRLDGDTLLHIFLNHPALAAFVEPWKQLNRVEKFEVCDATRAMARTLAKNYVKSRTRQYARDGNERKLFFSAVTKDVAGEAITWRIEDTRFVQTGKYVSGSRSHYEGDYDPPALVKQKRHLLYLACPDHAPLQGTLYWLLASDTMTRADYDKGAKVAERLMQAP